MVSYGLNHAKRWAVLLALPLAAPAIAKGQPPQPLEFRYMGGQVNDPVEQQSPNFFRCKHEPPLEPCDSRTWVVNPLGGVPCAWDVDDHFIHQGYGYVEAGGRVRGSMCVVADQYDNFGGDDHMLFASVYAPEDSLTVTLTNDRGVARPLEPVPDGNGYRWYVCHVDHTPGPYPEIPDSNGGTGLPVTYTLDVVAGSRTVRSIYATLEHPLVGTPRWFDAYEAGCF